VRYIIEAESGIRLSGFCKIGEGETIREAWEDAVGEKPWTPYQKRIAQTYFVRDTQEEAS